MSSETQAAAALLVRHCVPHKAEGQLVRPYGTMPKEPYTLTPTGDAGASRDTPSLVPRFRRNYFPFAESDVHQNHDLLFTFIPPSPTPQVKSGPSALMFRRTA